MKTITEYVDALRTAQNIPSDYALAKYLGLSKQAVSNWKNRGIIADAGTSWKIAEGIGCDPREVIAAAELERAKRAHDDVRARTWHARLRQLGAALAIVFIGIFTAPQTAAIATSAAMDLTNNNHYANYRTLAGRLRCRIAIILRQLFVLQTPTAL